MADERNSFIRHFMIEIYCEKVSFVVEYRRLSTGGVNVWIF